MCGDRLTFVWFLMVNIFVGEQSARTSFRPQNCTLQCVQQGNPGCEYCRISKEDVQTTLGLTSAGFFGGQQSREICQHYVQAPQNVTVDFMDNLNQKYETVVVSWNPSPYGIAFLQGFQVTLQALGGTQISCQLLLLQNNLSLSTGHSQRMFYSDPFSHLSLSTQYAVTVMALPVPESWDKFYHSKVFFTRTCPEKNSLEHCKMDWYPRYIEIHQDSQDIVVTFNLAPENLGISRYFSACFGGGSRSYKIIQPDFSVNRTHHTYHLPNLHTGTNYTCEIAADIVDAVRKTFFVQVQHTSKEPSTLQKDGPSLAVIISLGMLLAASLTATLVILCQKRQRKKEAKTEMRSEIIEEYYDKYLNEPQCVTITNRTHPPQILICYSNNDGPAHIRVVLQLATFLQKHMATQVHLDMWDALSIIEEGYLGWCCKKMKDSDFVMVICSKSLNQKQHNQKIEEVDYPVENTFLAIVTLIEQEICRAKAMGQDLSKYLTAIFEYTKESEIPAMLNLASNYILPKDFPLLFSHIHRVALQKPGAYLQVDNISDNGFSQHPAGASLLLAIQEAKILITS